MLVIGIRDSATANNVIVAIKLAIIILFIAIGAFFFNTSNWVTATNPHGAFIPPALGPGHYGWGGVLRGAGVVFFSYIGFDAISTAAQEAIDPKRDMARSILGSLFFCMLLYALVGLVITGIIPYDQLNVPDPIAVGVDHIGLGFFAPIVKLGAILGLSSVVLVLLLGTIAHLLHDGARWPSAAVRGARSSEISHALYHDDHDRHHCRCSCRASHPSALSANSSRSARCSPLSSSASAS